MAILIVVVWNSAQIKKLCNEKVMRGEVSIGIDFCITTFALIDS